MRIWFAASSPNIFLIVLTALSPTIPCSPILSELWNVGVIELVLRNTRRTHFAESVKKFIFAQID
jgi:hypothetical protein